MKSKLIIGAAFAVGGGHLGNRHAPLFYRQHIAQQYNIPWLRIIWHHSTTLRPYPANLSTIQCANRQLYQQICLIRSQFMPIILGGDHSCAIATWQAIGKNSPIGLLWIDAHFDSHNPDSSISKRLHGMPLGILLEQQPTELYHAKTAVIDPKHTVIFGVHSFEHAEIERLNKLNIRYYTMTEIKQRGFFTCFNEAKRLVITCKNGYGLSLDLDSIDPKFAVGVSIREANGLSLNHLYLAIKNLPKYQLKAVEIVEFNPYKDRHLQTAKIIKRLIDCVNT